MHFFLWEWVFFFFENRFYSSRLHIMILNEWPKFTAKLNLLCFTSSFSSSFYLENIHIPAFVPSYHRFAKLSSFVPPNSYLYHGILFVPRNPYLYHLIPSCTMKSLWYHEIPTCTTLSLTVSCNPFLYHEIPTCSTLSSFVPSFIVLH